MYVIYMQGRHPPYQKWSGWCEVQIADLASLGWDAAAACTVSLHVALSSIAGRLGTRKTRATSELHIPMHGCAIAEQKYRYNHSHEPVPPPMIRKWILQGTNNYIRDHETIQYKCTSGERSIAKLIIKEGKLHIKYWCGAFSCRSLSIMNTPFSGN